MCYINYDSQLTAYKTSSIYSNSASNLPCLLCSRLCFWSNLQKPDILSFLSHSDHEQLPSFRRPISNWYLKAVVFTPHWMSAWLVHVLFAVQGVLGSVSRATEAWLEIRGMSAACQNGTPCFRTPPRSFSAVFSCQFGQLCKRSQLCKV